MGRAMKIFKNKKRVLIVTIISALLIFIAIKHHNNQIQMLHDSIVVDAEKVKVGQIPIEAQAVGTLSAAKSIKITPEFSGQVAALLFQDGAFVKQGAPLIQLDDKVDQAKAESSKAALNYSDMSYKRMQLLGKQGVVARQQIESAQADLKQKQALDQENQVALEKMKLVAPFDGVLSKALVSVGDYVKVGQILTTLTDIQHLRVEYSVSEKFLPQLKLGQEVQVTTNAYPGKKFIAKVSYISPTINTEDRTISLYADLANDERLLTAGLFVSVTQDLGKQNNALLVPSQSLVPTIDGQQIYKIVNNKVTAVSVTLGQRTTDYVQILQGVSQNDMIVTAGQEKLKDGANVKINSAKKST